MSAAATAAGYLYAHGQPPLPEAQVEALEPKRVLTQGQSAAPSQMCAPKIEYRKRRFYALPSAA
jgi:hypothetical protein